VPRGNAESIAQRSQEYEWEFYTVNNLADSACKRWVSLFFYSRRLADAPVYAGHKVGIQRTLEDPPRAPRVQCARRSGPFAT
jgi:hypothetical protein